MKSISRILFALLLASPGVGHAAIYHLDSVKGRDEADGLGLATAWRSLAKVNATVFRSGDRLLLKCGGKWTGQLHPLGSGRPRDPIILDSYGEGPKPAIHGGGIASGAVLLENQQHWSIRNLEVTNEGSPAAKKTGILIRNNSVGMLSGIEVRDSR